MADSKNVLLLGMVFAHQATKPKRGQEFRDRVRCEAVRQLSYNVYSLDDKHEDVEIKEHCRANFADKRRMLKAMRSKWPKNLQFDHVVLDYFFSPIGWARSRWSAPFFSETLPALVTENILSKEGKVWLPNLACITECLENALKQLSPHYKICLVPSEDKTRNPLYLATEDVEAELLRCPDVLTNKTQVQPLLDHSTYPFYVLERVQDGEVGGFVLNKEDVPLTPRKKAVKRARKAQAELEALDVEQELSPIKKSFGRSLALN